MPLAERWPDALLAGVACSMRTFAAPAALAARGDITGKPRAAVLLAAGTELAVDKTPAATNRFDPPALIGRCVAGGASGRAIAGSAGAVAGTVGALVGTFATFRARKLAVDRLGLPDPVLAVGEDLAAFSAAAVATRHEREEAEATKDEPKPSIVKNAAKGVAAGILGTAAMTVAQGAEYQLTDAEPSMMPAVVADKMSRRAGLGRIPRRRRPAVNQGMHWFYGTSWGLPYGLAMAGSRVRPEISGPVFGMVVWGAALGHQPLLGIADPPWKRSLASLSSEALFHLVYGVGAGAALRVLRRV